ncbi:unnamed protein product [Discosporangium mesarthrocarpum]
MASKATSFRRFDLYTKAVEGVYDRTVLGAIVTVASVTLMVILFLSELKLFLTVDTSSHMTVADFHEYDTVTVRLHMTFPYIKCEDIEVVPDNLKGGKGQTTATDTVERRPSTRRDRGKFGGPGPGCTLDGGLNVARAGGSIRIHVMNHDPARLVVRNGGIVAVGNEIRGGKNGKQGANVSHVIHELDFHPTEAPWGNRKVWGGGGEKQDPLHGLAQTSELGPGQVVYKLKVVPISLRRIRGQEIDSFTYSVGLASLPEKAALTRGTLSNQWLGVLVSYDFSPVMVTYTETRKSALEFLTSVCAIVGGVFTVSGMVVQVLNGVSPKKRD